MKTNTLHIAKRVLITLSIMMAVILIPVTANAATRKTYTILSSNTRVYSNTALTKGMGWIYGSDEIYVDAVYSRYCKVTYPVAKGTRTGYISTSAILTRTTGVNYKAKGRVTAYRRPGGAVYGSIYANDTVLVLGTSGNYTQVKYPVSGGYKYAFVTTSDCTRLITGGTQNTGGKQITVFRQTDPAWKDVRYGYSDSSRRTVAYLGKGASGNVGSGCGVLALTNAVYYLNGTFIDPATIASYSVNNGYRVDGQGTAYGLYKSFVNSYGNKYGIAYVGYTTNWNTLRSYLQNGDVAICSKPGHIMALAAYNPSNERFLLLDSVPSGNRGTAGSGYVWASESYLKGTVGLRSEFRIIKSTK